jgi:hypothetical protein
MGTAVAKRKLKEALDDAVATIEPLCQELDLEFVDQPDDRQDSEWGERIEGAVNAVQSALDALKAARASL